jgi:hypothetical protein
MHPGFPVPNLTHIPLKLTYRTGRDDLVHGFFVTCLETSVVYCRAAGYSTSAGLGLAARGVVSLALRRGHMRLIVSRTWRPRTAPPWSVPKIPPPPFCAPSPPAAWRRSKTL